MIISCLLNEIIKILEGGYAIMNNNQIKAVALALCGAVALCGCSQKSSNESTSVTSCSISNVDSSSEYSTGSSMVSSVSTSSSVSTTTSSESASSSESSDISSSTTATSSSSSTTTNEPVRSTATSVEQTESEPSSEWAESSYSAVMYVNTDCYSRVKPILGFTKASLYHINDKVNVVAKTNTDFYKLDNGEFIHVDYLGANKITVQFSSSSASSSKSSSSSSSSSRHSDIVYIDIGSNIGRPLSDFFD